MPLMPVAIVNESAGLPDYGAPPVAGYIAWYDGDDASTFTLGSGNRITQWDDKSASGFDLTSSSGPYLSKDVQGRGVVAYDGQVTQFTQTSISMSTRVRTAFVVAMANTLVRGNCLLGCDNDGGNGFLATITSGQLATIRVDVGTIGTQSNANITAAVPFVAAQVLSATDVVHYLNLTSETDVEGTAFTASRHLRVGITPSASSPFNNIIGYIAEIVIYDSTLSSGDVTSVITHLMTKWDIS